MNGVRSGALYRLCSERRAQDARLCAPAFERTPARYLAALLTERGLIQLVDEAHIGAVVG